MIEQQTTSNSLILYDATRVPNPGDEMFDIGYWESQNKIVARAVGRGGVVFIRDEERYWVLRHYRRGGWVAKLLSDTYLWWGRERTRAYREWRLLHALHAQGLPVPAPIAARVRRSSAWYRADLITEALPATRTLADAITGTPLPEATWRAIGATLAKFHCAGVHHADLNAHNVLLGAQQRVFVIDFDRGRIAPRGPWERGVLARLHRSLRKVQRQRTNAQFDECAWRELLQAYDDAIRN